jgi:hypothetical protein
MKINMIYLFLVLILFTVFFSWITSCKHEADISNLPEMCFERDVLPIYSNNCAISGCHDGTGESSSALNNYQDIRNTVEPYKPESSRSYQMITDKWGLNRMPPGQPLSEEKRTIIRLWIEQGAASTTCSTTGGDGGGTASGTSRACFSRDILPVLISHCGTSGCHDVTSHQGGYNFTSYTSVLNTVIPGNPGSSTLYRIITSSSGEDKMPPSNKPQLSVAEIDSIGKWISYGALNETCAGTCDTINPVTYSGTIWPIINTACTGCHSGSAPSGNVLLDSYNHIATVAASGLLLNSLKGSGVTKMPSGGSLSACVIREFEIWINNGYLNN